MKNTNTQVLFYFLHSSRYLSNEHPCLKTTVLYDDLLLYLVCFTFSISYSVLPFQLVCFRISPSPFFLDVLSQAFIRHGSLIYIYIYICICICIFCIYIFFVYIFSVQFTQSCLTLCEPVDCSTYI